MDLVHNEIDVISIVLTIKVSLNNNTTQLNYYTSEGNISIKLLETSNNLSEAQSPIDYYML